MLANRRRGSARPTSARIVLRDGDVVSHASRLRRSARACREYRASAIPCTPGRSSVAGRVALDGKADSHPGCAGRSRNYDRCRLRGRRSAAYRTILGVPLLRERQDRSACIALYRARGRPVHRQADRAGDDLRRPGGHRHRERAAVQRIAGSAPTISPNRCSSRPPPPTCSRSSAARRSTCRRCSTRWSIGRAAVRRRQGAIIFQRKGDASIGSVANYGFSRECRWSTSRTSAVEPGRGTRDRTRAAGGQDQSISPMCWPTRSTPGPEAQAARRLPHHARRAAAARGRRRSASCPDARRGAARSPTSRSSWSRPSPTRR